MSVNDIAEYFGVSRRTVFRDMRTLSEINVPVTWDRNRGYGIMRGYTIPPLMFTPRELATVIVGLSFVKSQVDATLVSDAKDVEVKINNMLPGKLKDFMRDVADKTIVDPNYLNKKQKKKGGNWFAIYDAIAETRPIRFQYQAKAGNGTTDRKMDPYLMVHYWDHWNVIGYCHLRNAPRNFRLDRMSNVAMLNESFKSNESYQNEELLYHFDGNAEEVRIQVDPAIIEEFAAGLPSRIKRIDPMKNGSLSVSFSFDNLDYLNQWLLRFADAVTILAPLELKKKREKLLEKLLQK